jgi:hypothetical protein
MRAFGTSFCLKSEIYAKVCITLKEEIITEIFSMFMEYVRLTVMDSMDLLETTDFEITDQEIISNAVDICSITLNTIGKAIGEICDEELRALWLKKMEEYSLLAEVSGHVDQRLQDQRFCTGASTFHMARRIVF